MIPEKGGTPHDHEEPEQARLMPDDKRLDKWQTKLLPFMTSGLAIIALLFFVGTFWNYSTLQAKLEIKDPDIVETLEKVRATASDDAYQDWYMRIVMEERAMRSRHHQNAAVIESRVWTRFMGFVTGMVMVMAGCIFILGKLDVQFDGSLKSQGNEGSMKTNSPGVVLAVVGSALIAVSLYVTVNIEVTDRPVYMADLIREVQTPGTPLPPPRVLEQATHSPDSAGSSASGEATTGSPRMPAALAAEICKQAGKPSGCMK